MFSHVAIEMIIRIICMRLCLDEITVFDYSFLIDFHHVLASNLGRMCEGVSAHKLLGLRTQLL